MSELLKRLAADIYMPIALLLIIGGIFFIIYSRFVQYRYFGHAIAILRGKYSDPNNPGQISPYEALSTSLASTVGMGNIAGVAAAISMGGPGGLFWMWITAFVGMSTNFFSSTLSLMYRGKDSAGVIQGGPMYVIREAMSKAWHPLAFIFSLCAMIGCLPIFQANQLTQAVVDIGINSKAISDSSFHFLSYEIKIVNLIIGLVITVVAGIVIVGGVTRIGRWSGKMVPIMVVIYFSLVLIILIMNIQKIPSVFSMIVTYAFSGEGYQGKPMFGGILGGLVVLGVQRASFSSEAGIGTAPMAMGASKTVEPIREGLVSMLSPFIDTLIVCTLTGFAIIVTGVWETSDAEGVSLTAKAFESALGPLGKYLLLMCGFFFSITSLFSYSYYGSKAASFFSYGTKAASFIAGPRLGKYYNYFYLLTIVFGSIASMSDIMSIIDISYAIMAIPTVISSIVLAPKVMQEAKRYFEKYC